MQVGPWNNMVSVALWLNSAVGESLPCAAPSNGAFGGERASTV